MITLLRTLKNLLIKKGKTTDVGRTPLKWIEL